MRAFVPIQPEPMQAVVNRRGSFLRVARFVGIFDAQNKCAAVMPREEPVEERRARAADVQIAGRRWSETDADVGRHWSNQAVIPSEVEGSRDEIFKITLPNPSVRAGPEFRR